MVQISRLQLITMLTWAILGTGIVTMPTTIAQFTVHDAWMAALLMLLGGFISALVGWVFVRTFPHSSLTQALRSTLGPWFGTVLAVWYSGWLLISFATIGREFSTFVGATVLPNTPEHIVEGLVFCCVAFLVYQGIEVVARVNDFITPLALIVMPLFFALAMSTFDGAQLLPVLADGFTPVWRAAVVPIFAYGMELTLALQFVPSLRTPWTLAWDILIASFITTLMLTVFVVITIGVLGPTTSYLNYPVLQVVRSIRFGEYIERLDPLYVMGVVSTIILKLTVFHASLCQSLKDICQTEGTRWACWIVALAAWSASFLLFRNIADVNDFIMKVVPGYFLCTAAGLPFLVTVVQFVRCFRRPAVYHS